MTDIHLNGKADTINVTPSWEGIFTIMLETWSSQSNEGWAAVAKAIQDIEMRVSCNG